MRHLNRRQFQKYQNQTVMFSNDRYSLIVPLVMESIVLAPWSFSNYGSQSNGLIGMPISIILPWTMLQLIEWHMHFIILLYYALLLCNEM